MFKVKDSLHVKKGMVFGGCSFTWGQGLYYYSNLFSLDEPPPDKYLHTLLSRAHIEFKDSIRFPRLVANHFGSFEIVQKGNGGSNDKIIHLINEWFDPSNFKKYDQDELPTYNFNYNEVSHLVYQLTHWTRDFNTITLDGETIKFALQDITKDLNGVHGKFLKRYLNKTNTSIDELVAQLIKNSLVKVKNCLQKFAAKGVKPVLIAWPQDFVQHIKNDKWLSERFMTIEYKGKTYYSMEELMFNNRNLVINGDTDFFEQCPNDHHPSLECHSVMAKNIIRFIEKQN